MTPPNDERCAVPVEPTWQVETMMTADSLQLTACGLGRMRCMKHAGAVRRKPMVIPDALVYELCGLTEEEIGIDERGET